MMPRYVLGTGFDSHSEWKETSRLVRDRDRKVYCLFCLLACSEQGIVGLGKLLNCLIKLTCSLRTLENRFFNFSYHISLSLRFIQAFSSLVFRSLNPNPS